MKNIGVDIVEIERVRSAMDKHAKFLNKIFSEREIKYIRSKAKPHESAAGGFAAKEAFVKFLGTGFRGVSPRDIEVLRDPLGKPYIVFCGVAAEVSVSISHSDAFAVAVVIGEGEKAGSASELPFPLPVRRSDFHKGNCGRLFIVAGSKGMTGAACLASRGALRSGAGLLTLGVPSSEQPIAAAKLTEAMTLPLKCADGVISQAAYRDILKFAQKSDAVVFGCGIGRSADISEILCRLVREYEGVLVIDADGINALSENIDILKEKKCRIILTPHIGEMSRLSGADGKEILIDTQSAAAAFASEHGVTVALKCHRTVVANPDGETYVNNTGNCGMATGGTGDVLAGVIGSLAAQGMLPYEAAADGVFLHGLAGDIAAAEKGVFGMLAGDLAEALPYAIKRFERVENA